MISKKFLVSWIWLLLSVGGGYYFYSQSSSTGTALATPRIITVSTGSVSEAIKATGNISAFEESTLSFGREGIVADIYKKEWESVKAGDLIAEISAGTVELDMESANRNLSDAQSAYNELFDSPDEADLAKARATLEESEAAQKLMEWEYEALIMDQKDTILETEESLELLREKAKLAESEYEYTQKNLSTDTDTNNLERDIQSSWISAEAISRDIDDILEDMEDIAYLNNKTSDYYGDIGSLDTYIKWETDKLYTRIQSANSIYQTGILEVRNSWKDDTFDDVYKSLQETKSIIEQLSRLSGLIIQELDTTPAGRVWSSSDIDTAKSDIRIVATTLWSKLNTLNSNLLTLKEYGSDDLQDLADKNTLASKEQSMKSAQNAVTKAERDFLTLKKDQELKKVSAQNNLQKQKNTIEQNRYTYADLTDGPDASERRSAESKLASARISLARAEEGMKDYQISASFDGTIEDIPWTVWETAETTKWVLIANKNTYKIELSLDQIDIVKIAEWMPAIITLDAYADKEFSGSVIAISATPTITSGVVSYTATVWVSIEWVEVMSSMSTSVSIIVSSGANSILIPSWAVTSRGWKSYVTITTWDKWVPGATEEREVTLGKTTDGKVEILSGLTVGEKILYTPVSMQWTTASGSATRSNNQMMQGGMWWGTSWPPPGF